jgi:hypothetical protein
LNTGILPCSVDIDNSGYGTQPHAHQTQEPGYDPSISLHGNSNKRGGRKAAPQMLAQDSTPCFYGSLRHTALLVTNNLIIAKLPNAFYHLIITGQVLFFPLSVSAVASRMIFSRLRYHNWLSYL